ncbi:hypothetical protein SO802_012360 [Lithocarpus litseifolius]|uniref:Uncharacterized protein n=1 Tax=Lithocarpus litseifolius TaxID=425828 RepID=A0AAW2D3B3_9ROSI
MPHARAYFHWYHPIIQKYVDCNSAKLDITIESHLALLKLLLVGNPRHMHVMDVLKAVDELGRVTVANGQANNGRETESVATASPSTSATPVIRGHGRRATASPSPSPSIAPIIKG